MPVGFYDGDDVKINPVLGKNVLYKVTPLLNGSSEDMAVNGSSSAINFSFAPSTGETWYLSSISLFISDNGDFSPEEFANIAGLTNGLLLQVNSNGASLDVVNIKNNMHLVNAYDVIVLEAYTSGLLGSDGTISGEINFPHPMILSGTSDYVRFSVRDNLTSVSNIRAAAKLWRVNE